MMMEEGLSGITGWTKGRKQSEERRVIRGVEKCPWNFYIKNRDTTERAVSSEVYLWKKALEFIGYIGVGLNCRLRKKLLKV